MVHTIVHVDIQFMLVLHNNRLWDGFMHKTLPGLKMSPLESRTVPVQLCRQKQLMSSQTVRDFFSQDLLETSTEQ